MVIVIALSYTVGAFAASGLNDAEVQVIKMLEKGAKIDTDFYQYADALKNYFNRDNIAITQVQADTVCDLLLNYYDSYAPDSVDNEKRFFNTLQYVLMYLNVRIIYDRANGTADFIGGDGSLVMTELDLKNVNGARTISLNPIKQTGTVVSTPFVVLITVFVILAAAGAFICFKRVHKRKEGKA